MSERYGSCRLCGGLGVVIVKVFRETLTRDTDESLGPNERAAGICYVTVEMMRERRLYKSCGRCGGTGHSGDASVLKD